VPWGLLAPGGSRGEEATPRRHLASRDYLEAINYAFVDADLLARWGAASGAVTLANPLSAELAVMRTALLPGLVDALGRNLARQQTRVRLFEVGNVFTSVAGDAPLHTLRVAGAAAGPAMAEQWGARSQAVGFHDIKGDLESLAAVSGAQLEYRAVAPAWGHPGRSAEVVRVGGGQPAVSLGWIAQLHPRLQRELGLDADVVAFELDLAPLRERALPRAGAQSRFPSVRRDLAFVVPESVEWERIGQAVRAAAGPLLRDLVLFDRYQGKGVEPGFKSFAMGLILQEESRTLNDREVDETVSAVISTLQRDHHAVIRS